MLKKISSKVFSEELINSLTRVRHSEDWTTEEIEAGPHAGKTPREIYLAGDESALLDLNLWLHMELYEAVKHGLKTELENGFDVKNAIEQPHTWSVIIFDWEENERFLKEYFLLIEDEGESSGFRVPDKIIDSIESKNHLYFYCEDKKIYCCSKKKFFITDEMREYIKSLSEIPDSGYKISFLRKNIRFQNVEYTLH